MSYTQTDRFPAAQAQMNAYQGCAPSTSPDQETITNALQESRDNEKRLRDVLDTIIGIANSLWGPFPEKANEPLGYAEGALVEALNRSPVVIRNLIIEINAELERIKRAIC